MALKISIVTDAKEETAAFIDGIFTERMEVLLQTEDEMRDAIGEINVLVPGHINVDGDLIKSGSNLKMIHCGTGYNNVDLNACNANGTYVAVTPNVAQFLEVGRIDGLEVPPSMHSCQSPPI